jgi:hypothetical protein
VKSLENYPILTTTNRKIVLFYDGLDTTLFLRFFTPWDAQAMYGNPYLLDAIDLMRHSNHFRSEIDWLEKKMVKIYWGANLYE